MMEMALSTQGKKTKLVKSKALGSNCTQMAACMLAIGAMTRRMVKDGFSFLMVTHTKENGTKTKCMEAELICTRMVPNMLVFGKTI